MNLFSFLVNAVTFGDVLFWVYALIVFVIVLGVIILLHEGGHFFFAKKAGIYVYEFSLGFGPKIFSFKRIVKRKAYSGKIVQDSKRSSSLPA